MKLSRIFATVAMAAMALGLAAPAMAFTDRHLSVGGGSEYTSPSSPKFLNDKES